MLSSSILINNNNKLYLDKIEIHVLCHNNKRKARNIYDKCFHTFCFSLELSKQFPTQHDFAFKQFLKSLKIKYSRDDF